MEMESLDTYHIFMSLNEEKEAAIRNLYLHNKWIFNCRVLPVELLDLVETLSRDQQEAESGQPRETNERVEDERVDEARSCDNDDSPPVQPKGSRAVKGPHQDIKNKNAGKCNKLDMRDRLFNGGTETKPSQTNRSKRTRRQVTARAAAEGPATRKRPRGSLTIPGAATVVDDIDADRQTCIHCSKAFTQHSYLKKHIRRVHPDMAPGFYCSICFAHFKSGPERNRHKREQHSSVSSRIQCELCGNIYHAKGSLKEHMLAAHSEGRTFVCDICNKAFKTKRILKIHKARHGASNEICSVCGKTFKLKLEVQCHMRRHLNDRKIECESCGKKFYRRTELKVHMRTHTGERPYKCAICSYSCSVKGNLDKHMKVHAKVITDKLIKCSDIDVRDSGLKADCVSNFILKPHEKSVVEQWTAQYVGDTQALYGPGLPVNLIPVGTNYLSNYQPNSYLKEKGKDCK